jgi:hypothetical protein
MQLRRSGNQLKKNAWLICGKNHHYEQTKSDRLPGCWTSMPRMNGIEVIRAMMADPSRH